MKQTTCVKFVSDLGDIELSVDANVPLGQLHDFLVNLKTFVVNKLIEAQKAEEEKARNSSLQTGE